MVKVNSIKLTHQSLSAGVGEYNCMRRNVCQKSGKIPHVMSLVSGSVGAEDNKI